MHHCLRITEILLEIFEFVFITSETGRPDLARLARTCRSFSEPALDVLWRDQSSLLPLVMCFPQRILDLSDITYNRGAFTTSVKFRTAPSAQDWERPLVYAKRIRVMMTPAHTLNIATHELHYSVFLTLQRSRPYKPLLTNLRHLNYSLITGDPRIYVGGAVPSLFTWCSPHLLQSLQFGSDHGLGSDDSLQFLALLPTCCAQIEFLCVSLPGRRYPGPPVAECITAFASLQHLKSLDFTVEYSVPAADSYVGPFFTNPPNGFSSIINLRLNCCFTIVTLHIFKAIHSTKLRDINICFPYDVDIANLRELLTVIASRPSWKQSMRSISLTTHACSMTTNDCRGLLTFSHLRHLSLGDTGLMLDDHLLDDMAKSWPMLEQLSVTNTRLRNPFKATLNGIVSLSEHCPHITFLDLGLDAREIPPSANTAGASRHEFREGSRKDIVLSIQATSGIRDATAVTSFILSIFPRISLHIRGSDGEFLLWRKVAEKINRNWEVHPPSRISWDPWESILSARGRLMGEMHNSDGS
ncbi:hypothetical protein BDN67DRAFT_967624 [Paxillus ammoniavirescens]|nr:hypothetical protein BDN67DRAFT_967624 [Paxillus ammoniavirescens]